MDVLKLNPLVVLKIFHKKSHISKYKITIQNSNLGITLIPFLCVKITKKDTFEKS